MATTAAISRREYDEALTTAENAKTRAKKMKDRADEAAMQLVEAAEISSSAFTIGLLDGRYGGVEIAGVPLSLGTAAALHLTAFMGVAPRHLHAFGNGALAAYLNTLGSGVGAKMAQDNMAKMSATVTQGAVY